MGIQRIEALKYGVEDIPTCKTFFEDLGLELVSAEDKKVVFRTPANQYVYVLPVDDPSLPPAMQEGSTLRELIWGVDSPHALTAIKAEMSRDREVTEDAEGVLHTRDDTGYGIGFKVWEPESIAVLEARGYNVSGHIQRMNRDVQRPSGRARPLRIIHVAMDLPNEGHEAANDFYTDRLKFRPIDRVKPMGTFMQCEGDIEHHNFLLCHRTNKPGINHIALEVKDIDEVIEGGNYMHKQGWKESRRLGRHNIGSNVFRMFQSPCGGRIEYAADMDRMDKSFKPRVWEETPEHHLWMIKSPGIE